MRQRLRAFVRVVCGAAVIVAAAAVLMWLFGRESEVRFRGIVDSGAENVGPVEAARIVSIEVEPGQRVKAGDVLVRFDDKRMAAAVKLLREMAKDKQILLFTCQGREAEAIGEMCRAFRRRFLAQYGSDKCAVLKPKSGCGGFAVDVILFSYQYLYIENK